MDMYFYLTIFCLAGGNALSWFLLNLFFSPSSNTFKVISGLIIIILGVSSLLSFVWVQRRDNKLVRLYYFISASWMGVVLNFLLSAAVIGLLSLLSNFLSWQLSELVRQIILVLSTMALSVLSFFRAFKWRVRREVAEIKNLPEAWENKEIVHISDVHLGPIHRQKFFSRVIAKVARLKPAAVFISGDLFDGAESDFSWVKKPLNDLNAPLGVYYSFGNHDFYLGRERVISLLTDENITILDDRMIEKEGLQIIGLNFTPDRNFDLKRVILSKIGYQATKASILLFHEPKDTSKSRGVGIDLQLSGHTHGGQMFPFNYLANYFYHQHGQGLFRDHDYTLSVTSGVGTWGPPMRLGAPAEIVLITLRKK